MARKLRILFLCTGNSCRSQMAEAWTRRLKGDLIEPYSAGVEVAGIDPRAVKAMGEVGIDISNSKSKHVDLFRDHNFNYIITLCDHARQTCPIFTGNTKILHKGFDDPPTLALNAPTEEEAMNHYRRIRDEIKAFVEKLPAIILEMDEEEKND